MRILLACEFYYPSVGGVQEVVRQLAERFVEHGHEVTVATSFLTDRQFSILNGVRIVGFRVSGNFASGLSGEIEAYRRFVLETDFDVLMIKAAQQWTFDALIPVLEKIRKPKVFIPCGFSGFYEPVFSEYFRRMPEWLRTFDQLIFYASDYRDINFARKHGLTRLTVIPNGASEREFNVPVDRGFRARHGISEDAVVVLTVGSVTGLKGHLELAKAFERCDFASREALLLLNGNIPVPIGKSIHGAIRFFMDRIRAVIRRYRKDGALRVAKWLTRPVLLKLRLGWVLRLFGYSDSAADTLEQVIRRINSRKANRKARLLNLPRDELVQAYLNSDLFVLASKIEYSPLVLYEAAAAGLPFISVSVGNAMEIAQWTGGGIVIDAPMDSRGYTQVDHGQLAQEMARLMAHPELLATLRSRGRRSWEQRFTWDKIATLYEKVFEDAVHRVRGAGMAERVKL